MADLSRFRKAFENGDLDGLMAPFSADAVLHSPFTRDPIEGSSTIRAVLEIIVDVLRDPLYTDELSGPDGTHALVVRARVGKFDIELVDLIRFDRSDEISDFTVFVRPRSAGEALFREVVPRIAKALAPESE